MPWKDLDRPGSEMASNLHALGAEGQTQGTAGHSLGGERGEQLGKEYLFKFQGTPRNSEGKGHATGAENKDLFWARSITRGRHI